MHRLGLLSKRMRISNTEAWKKEIETGSSIFKLLVDRWHWNLTFLAQKSVNYKNQDFRYARQQFHDARDENINLKTFENQGPIDCLQGFQPVIFQNTFDLEICP